MQDNLLFEYIKNAVKEKQNSSKDAEPATFAERYCKRQLLKKKLTSYNPHEKMTHLMKNFRDLDTFVDLPELIQSIKKWKLREIKTSQAPKPSFIIRQQKNNDTISKKIKKELGQKIKEKYLNQNCQADEVLGYLQKVTNIRSDGLKNNSYSNLNTLFQQISQEGDDKTWKANFDFLELLHKANNIEKFELQENFNVSSDEKILETELNSQLRREHTKLLHKITTYLQIILQTEHKQKWGSKKYNHKSQHVFPTVDKGGKGQQQKFSKNRAYLHTEQNYFGKSNLTEQTNCIPSQSQTFRLNKLKRSPFMHKKNYSESVQFCVNSQNYNQTHEKNITKLQKENKQDFQMTQAMTRSKYVSSLYSQANKENKRNDSFYRTTSSWKCRTQATLEKFPPGRTKQKFNSLIKPSQTLKQASEHKKCKQTVKQNFTFRNRNIKQKIINKLSTFIREIDEEEHNNKKQNNYYNSAINKLQNTLTTCFGQFRQENIACDADIETLRKYATFYNHNGPNVPFNMSNYKQMLAFNEVGLFSETSWSPSRSEIDPDGLSKFNQNSNETNLCLTQAQGSPVQN